MIEVSEIRCIDRCRPLQGRIAGGSGERAWVGYLITAAVGSP
jgi:hypothetical protein